MLKSILVNSSKKSVKIGVSISALLLSLGATGEEIGDLANGEKMQISVRLVRAGVTGILQVEKGLPGNTFPHYTIDGADLVVYTKELPQGYNRLTIGLQYGTNEVSYLLVDIYVEPGATDGEHEEELSLDAVKTVGGAGGGDYKTDVYMDGAGRVMVERGEDGSTTVYDEHENPILKRNPDGTTEYYDAFQSVRQGVTPHGNMWLNVPGDGQFSVNGSMGQGASGNLASGANSHAEGYGCTASGAASHAEGTGTVASGQGSHAEGSSSQTKTCEASGENSHTEGLGCVAIGKNSHAEGYETRSDGSQAHAEGRGAAASSIGSHAEGYGTRAESPYAHTEGENTQAKNAYSHSEGSNTVTDGVASHAQGTYNKPEGGAYAFMHGCGTSNTDRRNAFLIAGDEVYVYGVGGYDGTNYGAESVQSLRQVLSAINLKLVNVPTA